LKIAQINYTVEPMDLEAVKVIGKELKQHRIADGISLVDVSKSLRIRKSYIKNIEEGAVDNMPFEAYLIGYIRHYADFLNLDADSYIQQIKGADIEIKPVGSSDIVTDAEFLPSIKIILLTVALTILSFVFVVNY